MGYGGVASACEKMLYALTATKMVATTNRSAKPACRPRRRASEKSSVCACIALLTHPPRYHIVQNVLNLSNSVATLAAVATPNRVGEGTHARISDVRALLGDDVLWVDAALQKAVSEGEASATLAAGHLLSGGGKRIRPLTVLLSAACFGEIPESARQFAVVSELIHLSTLLHDDVIDDSDTRRGRVTSRRTWGNAVSVLAGDLLLTHALERTADTGDQETLRELFSTLRRLVDGEVIQLRGRTELLLDRDRYFRIVEDKTAALFVWACRSGARAQRVKEPLVDALGTFGRHLGIGFQLVDDVLDYQGETGHTGKGLLTDLGEGKCTLPLLLALETRPTLISLVSAVREGEGEARQRAASALSEEVRKSGACESVRTLSREHATSALSALAMLPASRAKSLLCSTTKDLVDRLG